MTKEEVKESNTSRTRTAGRPHMERAVSYESGVVSQESAIAFNFATSIIRYYKSLNLDKIIRQYQQICNTPQLKRR